MRPSFSRARQVASRLPRTLCLLTFLLLTACATKNPLIEEPIATTDTQTTKPTKVQRFLGMISPYRIDIQQGNFVSREMISQVKAGMSAEQVRFALGTPLLTDIFHVNRWDYLFRLTRSTGEITTSRVSVFFQDGRLVRVEGGDLPTEKDYLAHIAGTMR